MSRCLGSTTTNESRAGPVVETTAAAGRLETDGGIRRGKREPIPSVIKVFVDGSEPQGRPYQRREAGAAVRLSRRAGEGAGRVSSLFSAGKTRMSDVDEPRVAEMAGSRGDPSAIDLVGVATARPEVASTLGEPGDDPRQQQMVPSSGARNGRGNESNGNSAIGEADIPAGSSGNETMNAEAGLGTSAELGGNLRRRLLWISATSSADGDQERGKSDDSSAVVGAFFSVSPRARIEREDLKPRVSDGYARRKRSTYSLGILEPDNEVDAESVVAEKAAMSSDDKQGDNEEYSNQNAEESAADYNDREEGVIEENEREARASTDRRRINPVKAKVDLLIKQKLGKKSKYDRREKRDTLDTIEYYDYDGDEEREAHDTLVNERGVKNRDAELLVDDKATIKRDGKAQICRPGELGKKKNENEEAVMKEEREKSRLKNKEPKEEFVVGLGEPKNKTAATRRDDGKSSAGSSESSLEDAFNGRERSDEENAEKTRESEGVANEIRSEEAASAKSKWSDEPFEERMTPWKDSEASSRDGYREKITWNDVPSQHSSNARVDVNPDIIENILLGIQPIRIFEQDGLSKTSEDFEDDRYEIAYLSFKY
ncbi:arginine/serine-rich protein PNISR-like [Odontomachus brunneus]|uniref:arginine/serine-rich protein PNISR-like n=1 Tax=Odontomachus brunneus TaxID=486640 RepID=UPI0013F24EEA|nr:arginine/serine-rich protein PNISR-like [Odontomachus brunneus]